MITDVRPYSSMALYYQCYIEPRRLELAEHMGRLQRIPVFEVDKHHITQEVDWHEDGAVVMGWYCDRCLTDRDEIASNECRRRVGK